LKEGQSLVSKSDALIGKVVHEGTHVADGQKWRKNGENMTEFTAEMRAYTAQVSVTKKFSELLMQKGVTHGPVALVESNGDREGTETEIYHPGWSEVDTQTAIGNYLKTAPLYKLDPASKKPAFPTEKGGRP
jgi:hypothetical protein